MEMIVVAEWLGPLLYLAAKCILPFAKTGDPEEEGVSEGDVVEKSGLIVYVLGVPFWLYMLIAKENWIFTGAEAVGGILLVYGILKAFGILPRKTKFDHWGFALCGAVFGFTALWTVLYEDISQFRPWAEMVIAVSFGAATYYFGRKERVKGWWGYFFMHMAAADVCFLNEQYVAAALQGASMIFAIVGIFRSMPGRQENNL